MTTVSPATRDLHAAVAAGDLPAIRAAAAQGADANALLQDEDGVARTALQRVIDSEVPLHDGSRFAVVKLLVDNLGADVNVPCKHNFTALHTAVVQLIHEKDRMRRIAPASRKG